jgi:uncharacterized membrane-anchored protein
MNPKLVLGLFIALALAQLAAPIFQIWKYEDVLDTGQPYKFRTAPVDPYDAFRGKYVALNYAGTVATIRKEERTSPYGSGYVSLRRDDKGFAQFGDLTANPPTSGDYLRVQYYSAGSHAEFRLPFDRFFMEECKALQAEQAYWCYGNRRGEASVEAYAMVRVKGGRGVIEDLFIKDTPIREFIKTMPK